MRCDAESQQVHWLDSRKDEKYIHILLRFIYFVCFKISQVCKKNDSPWGSFTPQITRCHLYKWLKYAWLLLCFLFFLYISLKILSDVDSSFFQSLHFLPWLLVFGLAAAPGWLSELTDLSVAPVGQLWEYSEFILSGPLGSVLLSLSDYLLQWEIRSEEVTTFYLFCF